MSPELLTSDVLYADNLVIQEDPAKSVTVTFAASVGEETLARGTVCGMLADGSEQYAICDKAAVDGSQTARVVLKEEITLAAAATVDGLVFGPDSVLNEDELAFAAGTDKDDCREDLRTHGTIIKKMVDFQA